MTMSCELAIDHEGEPFLVPNEVVGWRARRASDGRGRPELVYRNGKPLILHVNASHAELLAAAGAGKYRLDAVDASGHVVAGVPVACTGPLRELDDAPSDIVPDFESTLTGSATRRATGYADVLCQRVRPRERRRDRHSEALPPPGIGAIVTRGAARAPRRARRPCRSRWRLPRRATDRGARAQIAGSWSWPGEGRDRRFGGGLRCRLATRLPRSGKHRRDVG
jgi:hypothetical protein